MRAATPSLDLQTRTVDLLVRADALRFGAFRLKDGSASPFFIDLGAVATGPHLTELGALFAEGLLHEFPDTNMLFGPAYKGLSLASATAIALAARGHEVSVFFDRKEQKAHGEGGMFIGRKPVSTSRIVVIDDVTTSGATKEVAFQQIEAAFGVRPMGVLVAVDRRRQPTKGGEAELQKLNLRALVTLGGVLDYLSATNHPEREVVARFLHETP